MQKIIFFVLPVFLALFLSGCVDNDPIIGQDDLLNPADLGEVKFMAPLSAHESTADTTVNTGTSSYLLAGDFDGIKSRCLLRFNTLPDSGVTVNSARLILPIHRFMGKGELFSAVVYRVTMHWEENDVTWQNFMKSFDQTMPIGRVDSRWRESLREGVDADTLFLPINPSAVNQWINNPAENYGILIDTDSPELLAEFNSRGSSQARPSLRLFTTKDSVADTAIYVSSADAFIFERYTTLAAGPLYLGNGEKHRVFMEFDLDSIPANATINFAEMKFEIDTLHTVINDDVFIFQLIPVDTITNKDNPFSAEFEVQNASQFIRVVPGQSSVTITVPVLVQAWVRGSTPNQGFILEPSFPQTDLQRLALHSSQMDATLQSTLRINYTVPPKTD